MEKIAIVGAGMIGRGWAMVFATAGFDVALWDPDARALADARDFIGAKLRDLDEAGLDLGDADTACRRIALGASLHDCVSGAVHVQENGPEDLDRRIALFQELDTLASAGAAIASSTSGMRPSTFTAGLAHRERCLVAHPPNPPYLLPLVEICPAPWTAEPVIDRTVALLRAAGREPCRMKREKDGFILNRLQGALLAEAFRLIDDDVVSAQDLDAVITHGLGLRWAFMGPLETIDLNAPGGIADFCARYGSLYDALQDQMPPRHWDASLVGKVAAERRAALPADAIGDRQAWRDRELLALAVHLAGRAR